MLGQRVENLALGEIRRRFEEDADEAAYGFAARLAGRFPPARHDVGQGGAASPLGLEAPDAVVHAEAEVDVFLARFLRGAEHVREKQVRRVGRVVRAGVRADEVAAKAAGRVVEEEARREVALRNNFV